MSEANAGPDQDNEFAAAPGRTMRAMMGRAVRDPASGLAYALAILKGYWYRAVFLLIGRRLTVGRRFRVFGRLSMRGPGEVIIGDNVALWGRVNTWTYSPDARILIEDDVMMSGTRFAAAFEIRVGRSSILADASIRDTDFHSTRADRRSPNAPVRVAPVTIGRNVWVAAGAILLPGTSIGENSVVSAAAVCMRAFPANKVILGNPAKVAMPIPSLDGEPIAVVDVPIPELGEVALSK